MGKILCHTTSTSLNMTHETSWCKNHPLFYNHVSVYVTMPSPGVWSIGCHKKSSDPILRSPCQSTRDVERLKDCQTKIKKLLFQRPLEYSQSVSYFVHLCWQRWQCSCKFSSLQRSLKEPESAISTCTSSQVFDWFMACLVLLIHRPLRNQPALLSASSCFNMLIQERPKLRTCFACYFTNDKLCPKILGANLRQWRCNHPTGVHIYEAINSQGWHEAPHSHI